MLGNLMDKCGDAGKLQAAFGQQLLYDADVIPSLPHLCAALFSRAHQLDLTLPVGAGGGRGVAGHVEQGRPSLQQLFADVVDVVVQLGNLGEIVTVHAA